MGEVYAEDFGESKGQKTALELAMRIVSGKLKGRHLRTRETEGLRPTTEKVREAIFSTLQSLFDLEDAFVLDLYAGTGSLGLEALSRGARHATFVERYRPNCDALTGLLKELGIAAAGSVVCSDALKFLGQPAAGWDARFDIVFADPPYDDHPGLELARLLAAGLVHHGSILVIESASAVPLAAAKGDGEPGLSIQALKDKIYGDTRVSYFRFASGGESAQ